MSLLDFLVGSVVQCVIQEDSRDVWPSKDLIKPYECVKRCEPPLSGQVKVLIPLCNSSCFAQ